VLVNPGLGSLALVAALALLIGSSPLVRTRDSALVLGAGVVATVVTLWLTRTNVAPRFFSFLLVPLLIALASGIAAILAHGAKTRHVSVRSVIAVVSLGVVALISAQYVGKIPRLPRESIRDVGETIRTVAPLSSPVFAYVPYPRDLEFYLGRPVEVLRQPNELRQVCQAEHEVVFVSQPWLLPPATAPCTQRQGARHIRFRQYARGEEVNVWFIPPAR